ncbi:MAG: hypothetical protein IBJ07_08810 [Rhizobiaceae bacterium]|nr:hypothetical protein [Rhizobiaceae bacterium]
MWIRFTDDYNWRQPGFTIAYKAGMTANVTRACAEAAMKAGKAEPLQTQTKKEAGDEATE